VIDRLNAIAGLAPEVEELIVEGYLESRVFVARERERDRARRALVQADLGIPEALKVEGPEGIGRSRLLSELATAARLAGATVLFAAASSSSRPYEVALVLARQLLVRFEQRACLRRARADHGAPGYRSRGNACGSRQRQRQRPSCCFREDKSRFEYSGSTLSTKDRCGRGFVHRTTRAKQILQQVVVTTGEKDVPSKQETHTAR
jgi:hypothetical protein